MHGCSVPKYITELHAIRAQTSKYQITVSLIELLHHLNLFTCVQNMCTHARTHLPKWEGTRLFVVILVNITECSGNIL